MTFTTTTTTKRLISSLWAEAAKLLVCLRGATDYGCLLRMSAFSVGQAFVARRSSYLCHSCRARPANDGLHLLLAYDTSATSHTSHKQALRDILFALAKHHWRWPVVVLGCPVPCLQPLSLGLEFAPWLYRYFAALLATDSTIFSH
jgi:hypothetical protein